MLVAESLGIVYLYFYSGFNRFTLRLALNWELPKIVFIFSSASHLAGFHCPSRLPFFRGWLALSPYLLIDEHTFSYPLPLERAPSVKASSSAIAARFKLHSSFCWASDTFWFIRLFFPSGCLLAFAQFLPSASARPFSSSAALAACFASYECCLVSYFFWASTQQVGFKLFSTVEASY